jgi:hypothetical protein
MDLLLQWVYLPLKLLFLKMIEVPSQRKINLYILLASLGVCKKELIQFFIVLLPQYVPELFQLPFIPCKVLTMVGRIIIDLPLS